MIEATLADKKKKLLHRIAKVSAKDPIGDGAIDACIYEIRALAKTRIKEKLATLNDKELIIIQDSLCQIVK